MLDGRTGCPFCDRITAGDVLFSADVAVAFSDAFPVSPGHTLIVPRRHIAAYFDLCADEQATLWRLLPEVVDLIGAKHQPAGYNIGVNVGTVAGQTVPHVHLHVIPRYVGDSPDPRGGIRWVLPERAAYWSD